MLITSQAQKNAKETKTVILGLILSLSNDKAIMSITKHTMRTVAPSFAATLEYGMSEILSVTKSINLAETPATKKAGLAKIFIPGTESRRTPIPVRKIAKEAMGETKRFASGEIRDTSPRKSTTSGKFKTNVQSEIRRISDNAFILCLT